MPTHPRSVRRQRLVIVVAMLSLLLAVVVWPTSTDDRAVAATQPCGTNDANRASLTTGNGVTLTPCLSKVNLKLAIPRTQTGNIGCGVFFLQPCYANGKWSIDGVKRSALQTVKFADGSTESLYRLTFSQFKIIKDGSFTTTNGTGYTAKLQPDSAASLGGTSNGTTIYTDLWVTGASMIYLNFLTENCTAGTAVSAGVLGLTQLLAITSSGCGMDLDIRYAVTTSASANGSISGVYSVNMPDTTITVS